MYANRPDSGFPFMSEVVFCDRLGERATDESSILDIQNTFKGYWCFLFIETALHLHQACCHQAHKLKS